MYVCTFVCLPVIVVFTSLGDLMAPNLHNMDKLLRLPRGCGEQNMANFAPNVYVLQYLDKTGQLKEDTKLKILELLTKGIGSSSSGLQSVVIMRLP